MLTVEPCVQKENAGTKNPALLVLNYTSQCLQCFAVTLSIHRLTSGQEVDEENAPSVPEHRVHHFPRRQSLIEFHLPGRYIVSPIHWLLLGFWGIVCVTHVSSPVMFRSRNSSPSSWYRCRNGNADFVCSALCSGVRCFVSHLAHNFLNNRWSMTSLCKKEREMSSELRNYETRFSKMRYRTIVTSSSTMMVGLPLRSSSCAYCRPAANCLHQRHTICLLMTRARISMHNQILKHACIHAL